MCEVSFSDYILFVIDALWIAYPTFSKNTKSLYIKIIRQFFDHHWNIGLKEITTAHITLYLKNLGEVSHSTLNINRSCLSSLFDFLCQTGYLTFNPVKAVKSKKIQVHIDGKIIGSNRWESVSQPEQCWDCTLGYLHSNRWES